MLYFSTVEGYINIVDTILQILLTSKMYVDEHHSHDTLNTPCITVK